MLYSYELCTTSRRATAGFTGASKAVDSNIRRRRSDNICTVNCAADIDFDDSRSVSSTVFESWLIIAWWQSLFFSAYCCAENKVSRWQLFIVSLNTVHDRTGVVYCIHRRRSDRLSIQFRPHVLALAENLKLILPTWKSFNRLTCSSWPYRRNLSLCMTFYSFSFSMWQYTVFFHHDHHHHHYTDYNTGEYKLHYFAQNCYSFSWAFSMETSVKDVMFSTALVN